MVRPVKEWDVSDLQAFIDQGTKETSDLEWKSGESLKNTNENKGELAKDVSAMANANGGVIVYGIAQRSGGYADRFSGCDPQTRADWVEQVINSGIEPRITGVHIKAIVLQDSRLAFAVEVPRGRTAHQAKNHHKYYRRYQEEVQPMLDHEIRDVMRRSSSPELYLNFSFSQINIMAAEWNGRVSIGNKSEEPALYTTCNLTFDNALEVRPKTNKFEFTEVQFFLDGELHDARMYQMNLTVPAFMPIFKGIDYMLFEAPMVVRPDRSYLIAYDIFTPGFSKRFSGVIGIGPSGIPIIHEQ